MTAAFTIAPETDDLSDDIEALADLAFGPGRHAKTSYRLREGTQPCAGLSRVAWKDGRLVGTIRFSPILVGDSDCLLLGPLAVDPALKGQGIGQALMRDGLDAARAEGFRRVILVGDLPYYARVGFSQVPEDRIRLPGPFEPGRLLWLELVRNSFEGVGGMAAPHVMAAA